MKKLILSLAFAGSIMIAASACNSTKNVSGATDSTGMDTTMAPPVDTTATPPADTTTMPPDTIQNPPQ